MSIQFKNLLLGLALIVLNLKTAVGDANLTQSLEPESFAVGRSNTLWECPAPLQSDSNSRSCANLASRTAVSRLNESLYAWETRQEYCNKRDEWLQKSEAYKFSAEVVLNENEQKLDKKIAHLVQDLQRKFLTSNRFCPSRNYLLIKSCVENSPLFHILHRMPKGAVLHIHSHSIGSAKWLVERAVKDDNTYIYMADDARLLKGTMKVFRKGEVPDGFQSMQGLAKRDSQFIEKVVEMITMTPADSAAPNPWDKFDAIFKRLRLLDYEPIFKEYYRHAFEQLAEDNVQYVELRTGLGTLFDIDGKIYKEEDVVAMFRLILKQVKEKYPHFDLKLIISDHRFEDVPQQYKKLERAYKLRSEHPDFVCGYDLVGFETTGHPTLYYLDNWLDGATKFESKYHTSLPYLFHDGESDWANNKNLFDALLLGSKRIGHGFNLFNFPWLIQQVIKQDVCIEVCPISNQVLGYVHDLRMHPANGYLKAGVPCIISPDDPMMFKTVGVSPDFWVAIMAWNLDLKDIKQLCMNSIQYSMMSLQEKKATMKKWQAAWDKFVEDEN